MQGTNNAMKRTTTAQPSKNDAKIGYSSVLLALLIAIGHVYVTSSHSGGGGGATAVSGAGDNLRADILGGE